MASETPLVSVVMAVYNGQPFLRAAMDSILNQTYTNFELIVIDDASTDATAEILHAYNDPRIKIVTNLNNIGQTRSLNKGIEMARGSLIARHDADDTSYPERFEQQVDYMLAHPDVGLLGTSYEVISDSGQILEEVVLPTTHEALCERMEDGNIFCHGSVMFTASAVAKVGGYNPGFRVTQDYDLWLRLSEVSRIANLPALLYRFRFDGNSVSRTKRRLQLAYRQLALKLARQRRNGLPEDPVPADVLREFTPDPRRLLGDARRTAYLYFAAGQQLAAENTLRQAYQISTHELHETESVWHNWALAMGRTLAALRHNPTEGAAFIQWVFEKLPLSTKNDVLATVLGHYYADQAFAAFATGEKTAVPRLALAAVRNQRRWLTNRGLWAISLRSIWHA